MQFAQSHGRMAVPPLIPEDVELQHCSYNNDHRYVSLCERLCGNRCQRQRLQPDIVKRVRCAALGCNTLLGCLLLCGASTYAQRVCRIDVFLGRSVRMKRAAAKVDQAGVLGI